MLFLGKFLVPLYVLAIGSMALIWIMLMMILSSLRCLFSKFMFKLLWTVWSTAAHCCFGLEYVDPVISRCWFSFTQASACNSLVCICKSYGFFLNLLTTYVGVFQSLTYWHATFGSNVFACWVMSQWMNEWRKSTSMFEHTCTLSQTAWKNKTCSCLVFREH